MVNKPTNDFIRGLDVKEGETLTLDCPICNGVKKFTATNKDGLIIYNCYRNSCDVKGATLTPMLVETIKNKIQGKEEIVETEVKPIKSKKRTVKDEIINVEVDSDSK